METSRLSRLHSAVDRQSGVIVRIIPQMDGGYLVSGADPSRAVAEITAIFNRVPAAIRTAGSAANSGHNVELRSSATTIKFSSSLLSYGLISGDRVEVLDAAGAVSDSFRVSRSAPFGTDRTVAFLIPEAT